MVIAGDDMLHVKEKSDKMKKLLGSVCYKKRSSTKSIEQTVKVILVIEGYIPK
ncbi:hypothetical protein BGZ76_004992, partial [Entomortierella beljakovae]